MKKLFIIAILFLTAFTTMAQNKYAKSAREAASITNEKYDTDIDTLTVNFQVLNIVGDKAQIITSRLGKKYEVPVTPALNPFGYILEVDREYTICLERDMNLVYEFQTRGQTKTLPARMIWFTVSKDQLSRDQMQLDRFIKEGPGYNRSPRNGH